jgi:hypothetical protein
MSKSSTLSPIDDLTYDVIAVLQQKAQALAAYDKYINDALEEDDVELKELFVEMRRQDEDHILTLKESLARRLDEDLGYEDDEVDDYDDEDDDEDDEVEEIEEIDETGRGRGEEEARSAAATSSSTSGRGESSQRHR